MTDFVEWNPKHHGHKPHYWKSDMAASLDNKNFINQEPGQDWAWIAGSTYYVPYEAVHGHPRSAVNKIITAQEVAEHYEPLLDLHSALKKIEALQADKALKIPREPTQAMLKAGDLAWSEGTLILAIWQAMYDAALQETGQ